MVRGMAGRFGLVRMQQGCRLGEVGLTCDSRGGHALGPVSRTDTRPAENVLGQNPIQCFMNNAWRVRGLGGQPLGRK